MANTCYFNHEINCHCGPWVKAKPECKELHCAKCGWNPEVERQRREEVRKRYGIELQATVYGGNEV